MTCLLKQFCLFFTSNVNLEEYYFLVSIDIMSVNLRVLLSSYNYNPGNTKISMLWSDKSLTSLDLCSTHSYILTCFCRKQPMQIKEYSEQLF